MLPGVCFSPKEGKRLEEMHFSMGTPHIYRIPGMFALCSSGVQSYVPVGLKKSREESRSRGGVPMNKVSPERAKRSGNGGFRQQIFICDSSYKYRILILKRSVWLCVCVFVVCARAL